MQKHRTQPVPVATLYGVVFGSVYVKLFVFFLLAFMVLQPVAPIYAAELAEGESGSVTPTPTLTPAPEPEPEVVESQPEPEVAAEDVEVTEEEVADLDESIGDVSEEEMTEEEVVVMDDDEQSVVVSPKASSSAVIAGTTPVHSASTTEDVIDSTGGARGTSTENVGVVSSDGGATSTATSTPTQPESAVEAAPQTPLTPVDQQVSDEMVEEAASEDSADPAGDEGESGVVEPVRAETPTGGTDASRYYQFSQAECVAVGDGSYYCNAPVESVGAIAAPHDIVKTEPDGDGDSEIYLFVKDHYEQITHNKLEDKAPFYDPVDEVVVWHRLVGGRYEIFAYDVKTETEARLDRHSASTNNMQPTHSNGLTVWQGWFDDNWDIVLFDGETEKRITTSPQHDMAPAIQGNYILWHTNGENGEKQAMVYDLTTGVTAPISDTDGGRVMNPRFVLVYDTKFENGDVITKGFDPKTGEVVPLAAQSGPLPVSIPSPEPTGETKALIQSKSSSGREEIQDAIEGLTSTSGSSTPPAPSDTISSTNTATSAGSIVEETNLVISQPSVEEDPLPLTEFDLIIEPFSAASSSQTIHSTSTGGSVE